MEIRELLAALDLQSFVAFDFETTGLDPDHDRIIEFAGVRFRDGKIDGSFSTLVNPQIPIPPVITNLTSITDEMVADAPTEREIIPRIVEFLGDDPLVAHNVDFDSRFLKELKKRYLPGRQIETINSLYDTLILAQSFLYFLSNHRLGSVAEYFGYSSQGAHRALADTENVGRIFLKLIEEACCYTLPVYQKIISVVNGFDVPNKELYVNIANLLMNRQLLERGLIRRTRAIPADENVFHWKGIHSKLPAEAEQVFGEGGLLSTSVREREASGGAFEVRPTQIAYSDFVLKSLEDGAIGIIEAGTGVGKSLAYLFPALRTALEKREGPTVISCHTKHLQDQLFYQELPKISRALDVSFSAALMKGRNNYLCKTRLDWVIGDAKGLLTLYEAQHLLPLIIWMQWTKTGDFSECPGFLNRRPGRVLSMVCSDVGFCTRQACRRYNGCYVGPLRRQSQSADIVVINHALLLSELSSPGVLPPFIRAVIDEAHSLVKVGYSHYQKSVDHQVIRESVALVNPNFKGSHQLRRQMNAIGRISERVKKLFSEVQKQAEFILDKSAQFFDRLSGLRSSYFDADVSYAKRRRYKNFGVEFRDLRPWIIDLAAALKSGAEKLTSLSEELQRLGEQTVPGEVVVLFDGVSESLRSILATLVETTLEERDDWVYWYEGRFKNDSLTVSMNEVPVNVGNELREHVFQPLKSVILTSATLKIGNDFTYFLSRIGLLGEDEKEVRCRHFPPPFHYDEQCNYYQWSGTVSPISKEFPTFVVDLATYLNRKWRKRILILFTSIAMIEKCFRQFNDRGLLGRLKVFAQLSHSSRTALLSGFKNSSDGILLGTESFWQGIDLPRELLEVLIVTKLPFDVPNDPIIEAYSDLISKAGGNPFQEFSVPEAVMKLRQGFGRLIRSSYDEGVFLNLDNRVVKKSYGIYFSAAIPVCMEEFSRITDL